MAGQKNKDSKAVSGNIDAYTIDLENFSKRLKDFYTHWKGHKDDLWGASDVIVITVPPYFGSPRDLKSYAINVWLFGLEFPETIMVFMNEEIHFLCSPKKARLIESSRMYAKESVGAELVIHVKAKNADGIALMDEIFNVVRFQAKSDSPAIGYIAKETPEGKLLETWSEKMNDSGLKLHDVTDGFSELLAVKDAKELTYVKKAALLTSSVMTKFVVPKLEHIIDEGKNVSHSSLMKDTKDVIEPPKTEVDVKKDDDVDVLYPPIFQSGGKFDKVFALLDPQTNKLSVSSDDDNLYYHANSVIICYIGSRYKGYCSNVARTFIIDPTKTQFKAYEVLLKAHDAAICALKPGKRIGSSYEAAVAVVENEAPELLPLLTKSAGSGIGLEFCESGLILNSENDRLVKTGMVFNVTLGFHNLQAEPKNPKTDSFSFLLSDMVVIVSKMHAEVLTAACSKEAMIVSYTFVEEEEEKEERPKTRTEAKNSEASKEEKRRLRQAELARQKGKEPARSLGCGRPRTGEGRGPTKASSEKLQLATNKMMQMRLQDVWIRPALGGCERKVTGTLEAGVDGFLYSTKRPAKRVEINYRNIKHAFYQPAERETITLLHLHLQNDMMVSNKKTKDVQFYVEVIDDVQTGERSSAMEGGKKNKINREFQRFVHKVQEYWRQSQFKLEFDQPLREIGFHGQASTFMAPTSTCLVQLTESPFIVITLSEIEIFNLERVSLISQTNFDMTIIFKDFKREVFRVDMIPFSYLDEIKGWLKMMRLKFYERRLNMDWQPILRSIRNKKKFIEAGGWESLNMILSDFNSYNLEESDPPEDEDNDDSDPLVESDEEEEMERERKRKLSSSESRGSKRRG